MPPRRKGRRVPAPVVPAPGQRRMLGPDEGFAGFHPNLQKSVRMLADGVQDRGRGLLIIMLDLTIDTGIKEVDFLPESFLSTLDGTALERGMHDAPIREAILGYDLSRECVIQFVDVTPTLPNPLMWFDVISLSAAAGNASTA